MCLEVSSPSCAPDHHAMTPDGCYATVRPSSCVQCNPRRKTPSTAQLNAAVQWHIEHSGTSNTANATAVISGAMRSSGCRGLCRNDYIRKRWRVPLPFSPSLPSFPSVQSGHVSDAECRGMRNAFQKEETLNRSERRGQGDNLASNRNFGSPL